MASLSSSDVLPPRLHTTLSYPHVCAVLRVLRWAAACQLACTLVCSPVLHVATPVLQFSCAHALYQPNMQAKLRPHTWCTLLSPVQQPFCHIVSHVCVLVMRPTSHAWSHGRAYCSKLVWTLPNTTRTCIASCA